MKKSNQQPPPSKAGIYLLAKYDKTIPFFLNLQEKHPCPAHQLSLPSMTAPFLSQTGNRFQFSFERGKLNWVIKFHTLIDTPAVKYNLHKHNLY